MATYPLAEPRMLVSKRTASLAAEPGALEESERSCSRINSLLDLSPLRRVFSCRKRFTELDKDRKEILGARSLRRYRAGIYGMQPTITPTVISTILQMISEKTCAESCF